jgi:hypothetical protein
MNGPDDDVRRLLDELPAPAVRPVDLPALYAAAGELHSRRLRRWKRAALTAAAVAAGVFGLAVLPRLEVRAGNGELAVRWGQRDETPPTPAVEDRTGARLAALEAQVRQSEAKLARLEGRASQVDELTAAQKELKDLLLTVAADVDLVTTTQKGSAERQDKLAAWASVRFRDVDDKLAEVRKDHTAMYTLITDCRK